jgi:protein-disulfide isomerase
MRTVILFLMLSTTSLSTLGQKPPDRSGQTTSTNQASVEELKKVDRDLDGASERGDAGVFERFVAEQMINISSEGQVSKRADVIQGVKPLKKGTTLTITATDIQAIVVGESGVVTSNKTARWMFANGSSTTDEYRETNTYGRKAGQWFLVASTTLHGPPPYSAKDVDLNLTVDEKRIGGNQNASVVLIEFGDYECPFCRDFASTTMKRIERDYIDPGRIGFVFQDFPLESSHPHAFGAALAAQCASEQGHLWEMNHKLFAESSALTPGDLFHDAEELKLDVPKFRECFADEKVATQLRARMREASAVGIDGTPMFVVGLRKPGSKTIRGLRMIEGGYPYEVFKATLEMLIATQSK